MPTAPDGAASAVNDTSDGNLHDDLPVLSCADIRRMCVFWKEYRKASWTDIKERLRLVAEKAIVVLLIKWHCMAKTADWSPAHGFIACHNILQINILAVCFKLGIRLILAIRFLN